MHKNDMLNTKMGIIFSGLKVMEHTLQKRITVQQSFVELASTLRKNYARSNFSLKKNIELYLYKFEPNHFLELAENHASKFNKPYDEYCAKIREKKDKEAADKI